MSVMSPLPPMPGAVGIPDLRATGAPFTAAHDALRVTVRSWLDVHVRPHVDGWEAERTFPAALYAQAGAAGLLGWKFAPQYGGSGPDLLADIVVSEELACCGSGGVSAGLGAAKDLAPYYLSRFGTDEQRTRWLPAAVRGTAVGALGVTEPDAGSDVAALRCRAEPDGSGGYLISGSKCFITGGPRADWVLIAARTSDDPGWRAVSLFIVATDSPGFHADRIDTLGWRTSHTGLLHLDRVHVGADTVLGGPDGLGQGFIMIMKSFQWERVAMAVAAAASTAASLTVCAQWGVDGEWRALARDLAAVRALGYQAMTDVAAGRDVVGAVSAAKWLACDLAVTAASYRLAAASRVSTVEEERAERALRDARLGPIGGGAREIMADLVARSLPWPAQT